MLPFPDPAHENGDTNASLSRPDPAAYLHANPASYQEPNSQPLYPSGPTDPPPPAYFPLLYPNSVEKRRGGGTITASWLGALIAIMTTLVLVALIGFLILRSGLLHFQQTVVPGGSTTIINTGNSPGQSKTPTDGNTPLPSG
ncbi:MAG: hypothetical protein H0U76_00290, partial [Ktedonobacteraceae bacterium]|nr:hypothetical protein [Ktedonobacteraceae bacterium]